MERCELCQKEKKFETTTQKQKETFEKAGFDNIKLGAWTYMCKCPVLLFDELMYMRDNNYSFTQDEFHKFRKLVQKKKAWLDSLNIVIRDPLVNYYDIAKTEWSRVQNKIRKWEGMSQNERDKSKMTLTDTDIEVDDIHKGMWQLLYNLNCIKGI